MSTIAPETILVEMLTRDGLHAALRLLNGRTPFRYTGVYRFDGSTLRNVALFDRSAPEQPRGTDAPLGETYCAITGKLNEALVVSDGRRDARHPWMRGNSVVSYCGVPIRDEEGIAIGTLCHFDDKPCQSQGREASFLLCIADAFRKFVLPESSQAKSDVVLPGAFLKVRRDPHLQAARPNGVD